MSSDPLDKHKSIDPAFQQETCWITLRSRWDRRFRSISVRPAADEPHWARHGRPAIDHRAGDRDQPGSPGFATWPATKWPWFGELGERGHLIVAVHRGKSLLVSGEAARLLDPICRAEITRMRAADRGWRRLLDHLAAAGPSSIEDLRAELGLKRQELKALRAPLERCGAIVSCSLHVTAGHGHQHSSELVRWDQAYQCGAAARARIP